jgi:hypothetical protein
MADARGQDTGRAVDPGSLLVQGQVDPLVSVLLRRASDAVELYRTNAFRVLGLEVDATGREVARRVKELEAQLKVGMPQARGVLPVDPSPSLDGVRAAGQWLQQPPRRVVEELFWFWPDPAGGAADDQALVALAGGDPQAARQVWKQRQLVGSDVAVHNLAVLDHVVALDLEHKARVGPLTPDDQDLLAVSWRRAYDGWLALLEVEGFWGRLGDRVRGRNDPRLTADMVDQLRGWLPRALATVNARLAVHGGEQAQLGLRTPGRASGSARYRRTVLRSLPRWRATAETDQPRSCRLRSSTNSSQHSIASEPPLPVQRSSATRIKEGPTVRPRRFGGNR